MRSIALALLLQELYTFHKLLRIAHVEGMTWVVEILEQGVQRPEVTRRVLS